MMDLARAAAALGELFRGFESLVALLYVLFDQHDKYVLFALIGLEEAGLPLPAPTDTLIALAGYRASLGRLSLVEAVIAVNLGTMLGSTCLYLVMRRFGDSVLRRFGRYLHLDADRIERAEVWLRRNALAAVYLGRLTPGLRIVTSAAAGMLAVPLPQFLLGTALSSLTWCAVWLWVGWVFGELVLGWLETFRHVALGAAGIVVVGFLAWQVARRFRLLRERRRALFVGDK